MLACINFKLNDLTSRGRESQKSHGNPGNRYVSVTLG
jgi:hypothetical protein